MKTHDMSVTTATSPTMMATRAPVPILDTTFFTSGFGDGDGDGGDGGDDDDDDDDDDAGIEVGVEETTIGLPLDMFVIDDGLALHIKRGFPHRSLFP